MSYPGDAPRILLTGVTGQVGAALQQTLAPLGEIFAPERSQIDLANPASIRAVMREFQPRWVVNPAAYTAVDKAESEPELAFAINATAPAVFAEEARRTSSAIIHFSTDYVFDGTKPEPYVETDPTAPLNVYGGTKLGGEQALTAADVPHLIFRTSWVYGATGKNFLRTILKLARERDHLRIVADQHGAPTWSFDLARMTAHVIALLESAAAGSSLWEVMAPVSGVYHAAGAGETTWHGFAAEALRRLQAAEPETKLARLEAIPTAEFPTPAKRPHYSHLNCEKLASVLRWRMPAWDDSLGDVMAELE